jgi:NADH-quinone oxidoreductase subunit J
MMTAVVFYVLAVAAVLAALLCITQRNPVSSALWLVVTMFALAAIYVLLSAPFIAAMQVLVYAGAVMVLFLFVIMLLNLSHEVADRRRAPASLLAIGVAAGLVAALVAVGTTSLSGLAARLGRAPGAGSPLAALPGAAEVQAGGAVGNPVGAVARPMFEVYLVPFEITSVLLLAAAVGAVVLAKRKL